MSKPIPVFLDTSYIRKIGFRHPDFQKLIEYSKSNKLRLFVSHIAWEERRTQFLIEVSSQVLKLRRDFEALSRQQSNNFILQGFPPPALNIWDSTELEARSHEIMVEFARDNHITIVPLGADHADRAWRRYFTNDLPFNSDEPDREKRRKDIPDSWILEAAIDVKLEHSSLIALCCDKRFSTAIENVLVVPVFETAQDVLDHIDKTAQSEKIIKAVKTKDAAFVPPAIENERQDDALAVAFNEAESNFRMVGTKVIGLVSYLGSPTKDQVYTLLERSGVSTVVSKNVAERLALEKIILDTGNHYIQGNKEAGDQAKAVVEPEIIRLIMDGN